MQDSVTVQFLKSLALGQRVWLPALGQSLWPILLSGDVLHIERCVEEVLRPGDIAVLIFPDGKLVAHVVSQTSPLVTVSSIGKVDPAAREMLGKVVAFRRRGVEIQIPERASHVVKLIPRTARLLRRLPGVRALVRQVKNRSTRRSF